jgi:hypothetical protein
MRFMWMTSFQKGLSSSGEILDWKMTLSMYKCQVALVGARQTAAVNIKEEDNDEVILIYEKRKNTHHLSLLEITTSNMNLQIPTGSARPQNQRPKCVGKKRRSTMQDNDESATKIELSDASDNNDVLS